MKASLPLLLSVILLLSSVQAQAVLYDENATFYSYSGDIANPTNAYDGSWSTYATGTSSAPTFIGNGYVDIVYEKSGKTNESLWLVKDMDGTANLSLATCWDYEPVNMTLRIEIYNNHAGAPCGIPPCPDVDFIRWKCWNGTWLQLRQAGSPYMGGATTAYAYEEAMWWAEAPPAPSEPQPPSGIEATLSEAGSGLGSFFSSITFPVVDIIVGLGVIGGILMVLFGLVSAIKGSFSAVVRE